VADLYITEEGDLALAPNGDLAFTQTAWRDDVQQGYIRIMTDIGDFMVYPALGADLSTIYGKPQSPATGELGSQLIRSSFEREGRFVGKPFRITPIPTSQQAIRFDVSISSGSRDQIVLSVEQNLGIT
jgi:hypothetical protein